MFCPKRWEAERREKAPFAEKPYVRETAPWIEKKMLRRYLSPDVMELLDEIGELSETARGSPFFKDSLIGLDYTMRKAFEFAEEGNAQGVLHEVSLFYPQFNFIISEVHNLAHEGIISGPDADKVEEALEEMERAFHRDLSKMLEEAIKSKSR